MRTALATLIATLLAACATAPPKPPTVPYKPNFTYQSKSPMAPNSAGVTIAIIGAEWGAGGDKDVIATPEVQNFNTAISQGFVELATAKGMTIKGPFANLNELTYSDKKGSALALVPKFQFETPHSITLVGSSCGKTLCTGDFLEEYTYEVVYSTTGSAVLRIMEPQSGEFLWQKNVPLSNPGVVKWTVKTGKPFNTGSIKASNYLKGDQEHTNDYLKVLESHYGDIMSSLDKYVSAEEMQSLQKASAEIKAKKVY
jgi:hypothetical protein